MSFASVAFAALAFAAPAAARRSRTRFTPPPPPADTIASGDVSETTTSSSTSTASCNAEVKASTSSSAASAFVNLVTEMSQDFCFAGEKSKFGAESYAIEDSDIQRHDGYIEAIAELVLESKLKCDTSGKYALACATAWAGAKSFAAAGAELYASAWAHGSISKICKCAVDVTADVAALTSSWAEIWTDIYAQLDDRVCAETYDGTADSIKSEINVRCTGSLILKFWVKAIAKVITEGKCEPTKYIVCEKCCKDAYDGLVAGCSVEECSANCEEHESALLNATAMAAIDFAAPETKYLCEVDKVTSYKHLWYDFADVRHGGNFEVIGGEDAYAQCKASAYAESFASSASDQAENILHIWESLCDPYSWASTGAADFDETVTAWAKAYVEILASAFTKCSARGGDPSYDGGCARATADAQAYAQAAAEAIAVAKVDYAHGYSCECDVAVKLVQENIAHEIETITAFYETAVEARTCNKDFYGSPDYSYIKQTCVVSSMADMVAKSMASVSLQGGCLPSAADKEEYCKTQACKQYTTYDPEWTPCLEECTKNSDVTVQSALEAVATLNVTTKEYCDGHTGLRAGETYLLKLNSYTPPPPHTDTIASGDVYEATTSSSTSTASCNAEVKASTYSSAKSAFVDLVADMSKDFCFAGDKFGNDTYQITETDYQQHDGEIQALATLVLESKLTCDTTGKYALACASSWAGAYSFAATGVELYASAWVDGSISNCKCAVNVTANADALTSSWAEIWTSIYTQLDDHVCASSYDGTPDSVTSEINVLCVGNLILKFWVKAIAEVITEGKCEPKEYIVCEKCCKDAYGGDIDGCDVEDCHTECVEHERALLTATATAIIEFAGPQVYAFCGVDKTVDYQTWWYDYIPGVNGPGGAHFDVDSYGNGYASCSATAIAESKAEAISAQAKNILGIWESLCSPYTWASGETGARGFDENVTDWAKAYVDIFASAFTTCQASGGDPYYDGGCARAVSYSQAYAQAFAEAISKAMIDYSHGKDSCECDVSVSVLKTAIAHEITNITTFYETGVEARSCNPDNYGTPDFAYIEQTCWASSMADMVAKSMASVSLEGGCLPSSADKEEYCSTQPCKEYPTYSEDWKVCLEECTKNSDVTLTSALEAVANITVNTEEYCNGDVLLGKPRTGETYLLKLNGDANSTQT